MTHPDPSTPPYFTTQKLNGLYFYDSISEQRLDAGPLADIFVQPAEEVDEVVNLSGSAKTKGALRNLGRSR